MTLGQETFKIFNHWLDIDSFKETVEKAWSKEETCGSPDTILKNKLKLLKTSIKEWLKRYKEEQNNIKIEALNKIDSWDLKAEQGQLTIHDLHVRDEALFNLQRIEQVDREAMKQKSRINWAINGDENSKFFHAYVNKKQRKHSLKGLINNGFWLEDANSIKAAAFQYFKSRFSEDKAERPRYRSNLFKKLEKVDVNFLEAPFQIDEVKMAVMECSSDKAPGPDGMNFRFIKRYWEIIKSEFFSCVKHFEVTGKLAKGCNASFIVLIPKKNDPLSLNDYRPISLIGCVYKVISKLLSIRLAKVIHKIISPNQTAFLSGRQILDGCLVANEVIKYAEEHGLKLLLLKVDFEKAFDSINWQFLHDIMLQMGFGDKWCRWIMGGLSSASVSVLINGTPTKEFMMEKGLRQGDPLSPLLFLLVAETLQTLIMEACYKNIFKGLRIADGSNICLLQFADDALFIGKWSHTNAVNLTCILDCFRKASGLKVNLSKSRLYGIGVCESEVVNVANLLKCSHDKYPFTYLGLPVGQNMKRVANWNVVLESFKKKLTTWKSKMLSIGSRLQLTKTVLGALPLYMFSIFKAPSKVIHDLESIRARFLWGVKEDERKITWVKWQKVLASKDSDGWGVGCLKSKNMALLGKWKWRYLTEEKALWRKVINHIYGPEGGFDLQNNVGKKSGTWSNIIQCCNSIENLGIFFNDSMRRKLTSGAETSFWFDNWSSGGRKLKDIAPRLFALENNKYCTVQDRWVLTYGLWKANWDWKRPPRGRANTKLSMVLNIIGPLVLSESGLDYWQWSWDLNNIFSVKRLTQILQSKMLSENPVSHKFRWNSWLPIKVNIRVWRILYNRLPCRDNLSKRGINIPNMYCLFCGLVPETLDHCLLNCRHARNIWLKVWDWWQLPALHNPSLMDVIREEFPGVNDKREEKMINGVCYVTLWMIWNWRNRILYALDHEKEAIENEDVFPSIQRSSLLWIKNRCSHVTVDWKEWISKPRSS